MKSCKYHTIFPRSFCLVLPPIRMDDIDNTGKKCIRATLASYERNISMLPRLTYGSLNNVFIPATVNRNYTIDEGGVAEIYHSLHIPTAHIHPRKDGSSLGYEGTTAPHEKYSCTSLL